MERSKRPGQSRPRSLWRRSVLVADLDPGGKGLLRYNLMWLLGIDGEGEGQPFLGSSLSVIGRAIISLCKIPILLAIGGGLRNTFSKLKPCMKSNSHDGKALRNCPI